jgi:dihydropteroate synthase
MLTLEELTALVEQHRSALNARVREFEIGGRLFNFNARPHLMGVINLSPDSWYRESVCLTAEQAVRRGRTLRTQGADVVDLGAESTLSHAARADSALQTSRLLPVIKELRTAGVIVSVETYDVSVTRECLNAGASILNWTGADEPGRFFELAAEHNAAVIVCYVQGRHVRDVGDFNFKADPISQMERYFESQIEAAAKAGLENLIIDPGLGFYYRNLQDSAVRVRHQMKVFLNTFRLRTLGFPVCHALPHAFDYFGEEVRSAEPFFAVLAALGKTDLFRTHEVPKTKAVLDLLRLFDTGTHLPQRSG